jgi:cell division protein FtsL
MEDIGKLVRRNFVEKHKEIERLTKENQELKRTVVDLYKRIKILTAKLGETEIPPADLH